MYNNGRFYGNASAGFGYSPDRTRDVDRFNPSTRENYNTSFAYACGSKQGGYYGSTFTAYTSTAKKTRGGWYDGAGRYHED